MIAKSWFDGLERSISERKNKKMWNLTVVWLECMLSRYIGNTLWASAFCFSCLHAQIVCQWKKIGCFSFLADIKMHLRFKNISILQEVHFVVMQRSEIWNGNLRNNFLCKNSIINRRLFFLRTCNVSMIGVNVYICNAVTTD